MKKETTQKSKLWIWIVAAAVLLLAVVGVVLALVLGGQNNGPAVDPVSGPRPDLYWNLDREFYTANSQTGLSTREADANGQFKMRFAYNGEIVELVIIDKKLVNIIDTQEVLGLTFDENGVVIGQTNIRDLATEVGKKIYVKKATSDTIIANSSMAMNGMELNLAMGQYAEIYDLRMDSETLGKKLAPTDLQVMDCMTVYANANGDITHVYLLSNATRSKLYWRANMWVSASVNKGGLVADENGVFTLPYYCEGELVNIKTKDPAMVEHYATMGKHNGYTGLIFDDDGYAIDILNASVGLAGQLTFYAMDVESIEGNYVKLKNNWSTSGAMNWEGAIPEETPVYDVSSWAYSEGTMGQKISVKDLRVGDRITMFSDMDGNPIEIGITLRRVDLKPMFNNSSKYDAETRSTTRVKDADGYYVYTFIHEKGISKYKTKDEKLATFIDSYPERVFGIVTKGDMLVKAYEYECIFGYTRFSTALYVDAINGTILSCSDQKKANAYTAVLSEDYKALDISGDSKEYGTKIKLQEGDCMISFRNTNKEVCMIYVTKRTQGGKIYVNTTPDTSRAPVTKDAAGKDIKNPYWEFEMTDINGKQVVLQLPTGKQDKDGVYANKYLQSRIDNATRGIIALEVSGKTIKDVHTVGNMASGNSVGTVIITKPGTTEFEYKTAAKPTDEASVYPGWTGSEGLKMINISATINKYHGEKLSGGMKVNDVYYMVRNRANETIALFLYGRGMHNDFYFVKDPQGVVNGETLRKPGADGYYVFDVMYQGKATQVRTKDAKLAAKLDGMRSGAALKLDKSKTPYIFTAVADYNGTNDAFKSEVSNWDVSAIKGSNITLKLNIPTTSTEVGITKELNISGAKVYNISPDAGKDFGKITKLQKNDRIRIFSDKNGKITYVLVTVRNGVKTAECEHCGKKVTWNPITANSGIGQGDAHYYIFDNYKVYSQLSVATTSIDKYEVVIDLNGKTVTQDGNNARVFMVAYEGKTLTLMDSVGTGVVEGYGNSPKGEAGNANIVQVSYGGTLNILGGTYKMISAEGKVPAKQGGVIFSWSDGDYARNKVNIKGGTIIGGEIKHPSRDNGVDPQMAKDFSCGGALYGQKTDFVMTGGTVKGGHADRGGNVYLGSTATFTMTGGTIENGIANNRGGNFYGATGSKITIDGGKVIGGKIQNVELKYTDEKTGETKTKDSGQQGGNICGYNVTLKSGEITGGTAYTTGGNIFLLGRITETKDDVKVTVEGNSFTMTGGKLGNGEAPSGGGNIYVYGGEGLVAVSGGEIDDSGVTIAPETAKNEKTGVNEVVTTSTMNATGGKIGAVSIGNACGIVVGGDVQIDLLGMHANAKPMSVAALGKNAKIQVNVQGRFAKAAADAKGVDLEAYANNQIVSIDKRMGNIFVETDEKNVKWLAAGIKDSVKEIFSQIIADANKMTADGVFDVKEGAEPAIVETECPYCMETAQWAPLTEDILKGMTPNTQNSYVLDTHTHYYLAADIDLSKVSPEKATRLNAAKGTTICLHLNGKKLDQNSTGSTMGAILVANGATMTIMGEGEVTGAGLTYTDEKLGVLYSGGAIDARGTVNILGGTYKSSRVDRPAVAAFGAAGNGVQINMHAGTITKGAASNTNSEFSSNVRMHHEDQTFNMYGGEITGGMAMFGGNLTVVAGTFNLYGGEITGGYATSGNNVYLHSDAIVNMTSGKVDGGVYVAEDCKLTVSGDIQIGAEAKGLQIAEGGELIIGKLSQKASLSVTATGKFGKADAETEGVKLEDYANNQIVSADKRMGTITVETDKDNVKWLAVGAKGTVQEVFAQIIADANKMTTDGVFAVADGAEPAIVEAECPYCKETAQWAPLTEDILKGMTPNTQNSYVLDTHTHYYLAADIDLSKVSPDKATRLNAAKGAEICLHLNGKKLDQNSTGSTMGAILVANGATMVIMGEGEVTGAGLTYTDKKLGDLYGGGAIDARGVVNILGGTYKSSRADRPAVAAFGAAGNGVQINMYAGTITKGAAEDTSSDFSSNVRMHHEVQTFNMYGGTIEGGKAKYGGNLAVTGGTFNMFGGEITGGQADQRGGNIYATTGTVITIDGGKVTNGKTVSKMAGNIYGHVVNVKSGEITGGNAKSSGGNIFMIGEAFELNITGGKISGGTAASGGGNIYSWGGKGTIAISGGEITDGVSTNGIANNIQVGFDTEKNVYSTMELTGGNVDGGVYVAKECKLTVSGDAKIGTQWSGLQIADGAELLIGELSENALLPITADGMFAKAAEGVKVDLKALIGKQIVAVKPALSTISVVKDDKDVEWLSASNKSLMEVYGPVVDASAAQSFTGATMEEKCEYCGKTVTWTGITQAMVDTALAQTNGFVLDTAAHTHYFLAEDITMPAFDGKSTRFTTTKGTNSVVCLHLNDKTLDQNAGSASANGVLFVSAGTTMNIMGNGTVIGTGITASNMYGGALDVRGSANIFGGLYKSSNPDRPAVALFSAATDEEARNEQLAARVINMFGGAIVNGAGTTEKDGASNVWLNSKVHQFNMYGGTIANGQAKYGGNLRIKDGTFNMYGGEIIGGTAQRGGNIYVPGGTFNLIDGTVSDGTNTNNLGGHFYITNGTVNIKGGKVLNGTGVNSGGAFGMNGTGKLNISGGVIDGATTVNDGGLIYIYNGNLNISGGELKNGSSRDGGLIAVGGTSTGTVTITGGTFYGGKATRDGGLLSLSCDAEITGGTFSNGTAKNGKGINVGGSKKLTLGAVAETVDVRMNAKGTLNVLNGAKANVEFTTNTSKLVLADDLAKGTVITVTYNALDEAPLSETNANAKDYVNAGYVVSANPAKALKVNKDNQIFVPSVATVANDLSALFATEVPAGKQYHEAYCPVCGQLAQWVPLSKELTSLDNSHYYLTDNVTREDGNRYSTVANVTTCVFLNGKTYNQGTTDNKEGAIKVLANSTLNIFDTSDNKGTVIGAGAEHNIGTSTAPNKQVTGGAIDVRGTVNIYGGTYKTSRADRPAVGLWQDSSVVNMYGGRIVKGDAIADISSANSSNVRIRTKGTFNMFGGEITGGKATQGGNVYMANGEFNMSGGEIAGGAAKTGGNVYMANGEFNMSGGTISGGKVTRGGTTDEFGGNVAVAAGTFTMTGGTITGGEGSRGGNIYTVSGSTFEMSGGTVSNGASDNFGGNFYVKGTVKITGGEVLNGTCNSSGGSFGVHGGTLNISGATITGGVGANGGLIYVYSGTLKITGGELKNGTGAGGNILLGGGTNTITGGTITGGKTKADETGVARDVTVNGGKALTLGKDANVGKLYVGGTVTVQNGTVATVELTSAGRIAFAADVAEGTKITVIASANQTIATVDDAANYLKYFEAGVTGADFAVKDGTTNEIVMTQG